MNRYAIFLFLILVAILTTSSFLLAEDAATRKPLSLQDCITIALQNQVDLLTGQNSLESARAREVRAKDNYFPQASIRYSNTINESGITSQSLNDGTTFTMTQNFYDGGLREAQIRGARANVSANQFGLERTRQVVEFSVTRSYFDLLRARRLSEVEDARLKYLQGQLQLVRTQVELGEAAKVDTLPVEAQLANAQVDNLRAKNNVRTAEVQLQNDMGLSPQPDFTVQEIDEPVQYQVQSIDEYTKLALAQRPDIMQTEAGVKSAKSSVDSARISMMPRPVVSGQYDRQISGGFSDRDDAYSIVGGISFDLNAALNRSAYREAKANLSTAELQAAQIEKNIKADIQTAYLNLVSSRERLQASDLSLKAAQSNLDAQEGRYAQGLAIPLDLLNAQSQLVQSQSNAVQAQYDYYTAIAQLEYAVGAQGGLYAK